MKKSILLLSAIAIFAACSDTDSFKDVKTQNNTTIGFATFTGKQTRGADNSNSSTINTNLQAHHESFVVWGYKTALNADGTTERHERVFNKQEVDFDVLTADEWDYTPHGFWDKQASGYRFHAAAPAIDVNNNNADMGWTITDGGATYAPDANTTKYEISLPSFSVDGVGLDVDETATLPASVTSKAVMPNHKDLMISEDITGYKNYSSEAVHLHFFHILSRLNIGVKKDAVLNDYTVKLKSVKVFNMKSNGQFNEGEDLGEVPLASGTVKRWKDVTTTTTFSEGVGFTATTEGGVEITTNLGYVYEALVIPQNVDYQTIDVNGKARATEREYYGFDEYVYTTGNPNDYSSTEYATGKDDDTQDDLNINKNKPVVEAASAPYILINYTITPTNGVTEEFIAYYNLAAAFGKNLSTATGTAPNQVNQVAFNEGWMNTLNITIKPIAISFDADVYEWAEKTPQGSQTVD